MNDVKVAKDFMRRHLVTLSPTTNVLDGIARLLRDNISGAPVVNDRKKYIGVFSEKGCMRAFTEPVEAASELGIKSPKVREFMKRDLITCFLLDDSRNDLAVDCDDLSRLKTLLDFCARIDQ